MADTYVHVIAGIAVLSRVADVWTTYLVTPNLKLEANSVVRWLGWPFALLTILIGFVPYYWPPLGIVVFTASFLVAASNASKIVIAKALGEDELAALNRRIILNTPPWPGLFYLILPAVFIAALGAAILFFYPWEPAWGYYVGIGMFAYAFAILVWYPVRYFRSRSRALKN
jgi:hypothetical protein